jgi:hypothetical protein
MGQIAFSKITTASFGILLAAATAQAGHGVGDGGGTGALRAQCRFLDPAAANLSLTLSNGDFVPGHPGSGDVINAGLYQEISPGTSKILFFRSVVSNTPDPSCHLFQQYLNAAGQPAFTLNIYQGMVSPTEHQAELKDTVLDDGNVITCAQLACFVPN